MNQIAVITPDLLSEATEDGLRRSVRLWLEQFDFAREVCRLAPYPGVVFDDVALLGLDPRHMALEQGPLTVAALGHEPPQGSTHYHVTPLSLRDGILAEPNYQWPQELIRKAAQACQLLNTRRLTLLDGFGADLALVIEDGSMDMGCPRPSEVIGQAPSSCYPDGDDGPLLRRFIDDSANILLEQPFNHERIEEGLDPLAVFWPWGCGFRPELPNLALRRGQPAHYVSSRLRLAGAARLCRYRHEPWYAQPTGTRVAWENLAEFALKHERAIVVIDSWSEFKAQGVLEEAEWLLNEMLERFWKAMERCLLHKLACITWLAPASSEADGLALQLAPHTVGAMNRPFDGRLLEDSKVPRRESNVVMDSVLSRSGGSPW